MLFSTSWNDTCKAHLIFPAMLVDKPLGMCFATLEHIVNTHVQPLSYADGRLSTVHAHCRHGRPSARSAREQLQLSVSAGQAIIAVSSYLSVGSTWTYLELPATNVTTAKSMAAAGMAKPMVQLTLSWMYTRVVTARNEPKLMAK